MLNKLHTCLASICIACCPGGVAFSNAFFGVGSGPIFLDRLNCGLNDTRVLDCVPRSRQGLPECNHDRDVGIYCEGVSVYVHESTAYQLGILSSENAVAFLKYTIGTHSNNKLWNWIHLQKVNFCYFIWQNMKHFFVTVTVISCASLCWLVSKAYQLNECKSRFINVP